MRENVTTVGAAADELMAVFAAAHELFVERFHGVSLSVPILDKRFAAFGFGNLKGEFSVYEGATAIPLSNAPLALRVKLVDYVPDLWNECAKRVGDRVQDVCSATSTLRAFIDSKEQDE